MSLKSSFSPVKPGLPRIVELAIAVPGLVVLSPLVGLAALAIVMTSRGPAFFRQERVGANGQVFRLIKLRTMRSSNEGPQVTAADDARVTAVGRFLRATKLDELPQLWNVIRGDMSLVGPTPRSAAIRRRKQCLVEDCIAGEARDRGPGYCAPPKRGTSVGATQR